MFHLLALILVQAAIPSGVFKTLIASSLPALQLSTSPTRLSIALKFHRREES